jgi:hypothetical protein
MVKFFHGIKVQTHVNMLKPKRSGPDDIKTVVITFRVPLNGNVVRSAPAVVKAAYEAVDKDSCDNYGITKEFDKIDSEFYVLEEHKRPEMKLPALHFQKLAVVRTENSQGDPCTVLTFQTEYPWDKGIWEWLGDHYGTDVWLSFDSAQGVLIDIEPEEGEEKPSKQTSFDMATETEGNGNKSKGKAKKAGKAKDAKEAEEPAVQ